MEKKKMIQIGICCFCFLAMIYGIARLDKGHRKYHDELTTMAEEDHNKDTQGEASSKQRIMYLTFDDGPSEHTREILDILNKYHIKATFFVTGMNADYSHMIHTIQEEGHAIGLHSFSHDYEQIYSSVEAYFDDLGKISALVKAETGTISNIIRFPGGSSNTVSKQYSEGIMTKLSEQCQNLGYAYYDWNADNGDGDASLSADALYENVMKRIQGKDEVMLLLHDGSENHNTLLSLDQTLQELIRQGFEFRIIDKQMTSVFHHHIAN